MLNFQEKIERVKDVVEILHAMGGGLIYVDLHEASQEDVTISYFVPEKARLGVFLYIKSLCGKLEKENGGIMRGATANHINFTLFGILECKQVGTKTVEKPVMVATGEVEQVEVPVYECLTPLAEAAKESGV